jgi:hypothetical protein
MKKTLEIEFKGEKHDVEIDVTPKPEPGKLSPILTPGKPSEIHVHKVSIENSIIRIDFVQSHVKGEEVSLETLLLDFVQPDGLALMAQKCLVLKESMEQEDEDE